MEIIKIIIILVVSLILIDFMWSIIKDIQKNPKKWVIFSIQGYLSFILSQSLYIAIFGTFDFVVDFQFVINSLKSNPENYIVGLVLIVSIFYLTIFSLICFLIFFVLYSINVNSFRPKV